MWMFIYLLHRFYFLIDPCKKIYKRIYCAILRTLRSSCSEPSNNILHFFPAFILLSYCPHLKYTDNKCVYRSPGHYYISLSLGLSRCMSHLGRGCPFIWHTYNSPSLLLKDPIEGSCPHWYHFKRSIQHALFKVWNEIYIFDSDQNSFLSRRTAIWMFLI